MGCVSQSTWTTYTKCSHKFCFIIAKMPQSPNATISQARLTIIPESTLKLERDIGGGEFGTVYKVSPVI